MNFVKAEVGLEFTQIDDLNPLDVYKKIERIGRLCYKSEGLITETSHEKFIDKIKANGHNAMIEHHRFMVQVDPKTYDGLLAQGHSKYLEYTNAVPGVNGRYVVSGSARAWIEAQHNPMARGICRDLHSWYPLLFAEKDLKGDISPWYGGCSRLSSYDITNLTDEERLKHQGLTAKFICDRGVTHEIVRHRPASYAQESTRYCNYTKEKFGGELCYVLPLWMAKPGGESKYHGQWRFIESINGYAYLLNEESGRRIHNLSLADQNYMRVIQTSESAYLNLIELGWQPQQARDVLPNSLKTEIYMTATLEEWMHFFKLRAADTAHPQMQEVAYALREQFTDNKYLSLTA